jgi:hypothetical protein
VANRAILIRYRIPEEELIKRLMRLDPPEINLRLPKDESESNLNSEW